eukprot:gnl/TRDRNA2_/TRDRNA2_94778_c0_seq1.p1 gnl/TRDRNA2_/TRDRNA2_94778_c0~~gnl/TRDRNA2_/TRDRNA2_94778_c0_seq1.p1  ORF type:complete len:742 (-),score=114.40 gnl/TRDRNA2_/TRDRNA2_94778_c0_seq1:206-2431(-)
MNPTVVMQPSAGRPHGAVLHPLSSSKEHAKPSSLELEDHLGLGVGAKKHHKSHRHGQSTSELEGHNASESATKERSKKHPKSAKSREEGSSNISRDTIDADSDLESLSVTGKRKKHHRSKRDLSPALFDEGVDVTSKSSGLLRQGSKSPRPLEGSSGNLLGALDKDLVSGLAITGKPKQHHKSHSHGETSAAPDADLGPALSTSRKHRNRSKSPNPLESTSNLFQTAHDEALLATPGQAGKPLRKSLEPAELTSVGSTGVLRSRSPSPASLENPSRKSSVSLTTVGPANALRGRSLSPAAPERALNAITNVGPVDSLRGLQKPFSKEPSTGMIAPSKLTSVGPTTVLRGRSPSPAAQDRQSSAITNLGPAETLRGKKSLSMQLQEPSDVTAPSKSSSMKPTGELQDRSPSPAVPEKLSAEHSSSTTVLNQLRHPRGALMNAQRGRSASPAARAQSSSESCDGSRCASPSAQPVPTATLLATKDISAQKSSDFEEKTQTEKKHKKEKKHKDKKHKDKKHKKDLEPKFEKEIVEQHSERRDTHQLALEAEKAAVDSTVLRFLLSFDPPSLAVEWLSRSSGERNLATIRIDAHDLGEPCVLAGRLVCEKPYLGPRHRTQLESLLSRLATRRHPIHRVMNSVGVDVRHEILPNAAITFHLPAKALVLVSERVWRPEGWWIKLLVGGGWVQEDEGALSHCDPTWQEVQDWLEAAMRCEDVVLRNAEAVAAQIRNVQGPISQVDSLS